MIKRLIAFDMDGCLINSPMPDTGKKIWKEKTGNDYPFLGWWGRKESLDLNVFDIKPFTSMYQQYKKEKSTPNTYVIVLTSRMEKLRPEVQAILDANNIYVDKLDMKYNGLTKGERVLEYINNFPDLVEVSVFDDRDSDLESYKNIVDLIPDNITFNIYRAFNGNFALIESENRIEKIINEVIDDFVSDI